MSSFMRKVVGKKCAEVDCPERDKLLAPHIVLCEGCGSKLLPVTVVDRRAALIGVIAAVVLITVLAAGLKMYVAGVVASRERALMERGITAARTALAGVTRAEADAVLARIAGDLDLSSEQRANLGSALRREIDSLPNELTVELKAQLETIVRGAAAEGRHTAPDDPRVVAFITDHRLSDDSVRAFIADADSRATSAAAAIAEGKRLASEGRFDEAEGAFKRAADADPANPIAWANLGAAAMLAGRSSEALNHYAQALRLDPENWLAHYNLGIHYARRMETSQALTHLEAAVRRLRQEQRGKADLQSVVESLRTDEALKELRNDARYQRLLAN